jgi:GH15 family glucan-1,4-alpha-glucosidase
MALDVRTGPVTQVAPAGALGAQRARYLPIAEHGLIGDLHTVALVGTDGTIDWYCCPRFGSPSVFAAILDADRGGLFRFGPDGDGWTSKQLYITDTNVLITRFLMADGVGEVQDFMVPAHPGRLIRRVVAVRGEVRFVVDVAPRFDYARAAGRRDRHRRARTTRARRAAGAVPRCGHRRRVRRRRGVLAGVAAPLAL